MYTVLLCGRSLVRVKDYPLQPGESFLIVQEARDHRVNNASSFDNSMAEWEAWSGNAGRDNPEVPNIAYVFWINPIPCNG